MMDFWEEAHAVDGKESLSLFLAAAARNFEECPEAWENGDIASLLEAMSAWVLDSDGFFRGMGKELPSAECWSMVAMVMAAGRVYE